MNTQQPCLRFRLHQAAVDAFKAVPPPPVVITKASLREHRDAVKAHYLNALCVALPEAAHAPNGYQRKIWRGILKRLRGEPTTVPPLFRKKTIIPALREWAEKRGLI